jgi:molecular chaperone DnaK
MATGKSQAMTITGGTALPRDEIDRMVKDAESHANEDKRRREEAEARNQADNAIYAVEKALKETGDKASESERTEIQAKIDAAKQTLTGTDIEAIKKATEELLEASHKLAQQAYGQQQQAAAAGGGVPETAPADDVVEGEVVDDGDSSG